MGGRGGNRERRPKKPPRKTIPGAKMKNAAACPPHFAFPPCALLLALSDHYLCLPCIQLEPSTLLCTAASPCFACPRVFCTSSSLAVITSTAPLSFLPSSTHTHRHLLRTPSPLHHPERWRASSAKTCQGLGAPQLVRRTRTRGRRSSSIASVRTNVPCAHAWTTRHQHQHQEQHHHQPNPQP